MQKGNMKRDIKGCKYCKGDYPKDYVLRKIKEVNPNVELLEPYVNITTRIKCRCKIHNIISTKSPQEILKGRGCYKCGLEKLSTHKLYSQEEFEKMAYKANSNLMVAGKYFGMLSPIAVKCKKCGHEWSINAQSLISNGTSCKKCSCHFKGEEMVVQILDSWSYKYIEQYKFESCKDKRQLPFDFYLPDFNTCIEFDGQQHYEPRFGEKAFNKTLVHDNIKNNFCVDNNIKLIRIPYWKYNDLEYYLFSEFVNNNILEELASNN